MGFKFPSKENLMKNLINAIIVSEDRGYHRNLNKNSHIWKDFRGNPP